MILSRAWLHQQCLVQREVMHQNGIIKNPFFETPCSNRYWGWNILIILDYRDISLMESVPLLWHLLPVLSKRDEAFSSPTTLSIWNISTYIYIHMYMGSYGLYIYIYIYGLYTTFCVGCTSKYTYIILINALCWYSFQVQQESVWGVSHEIDVVQHFRSGMAQDGHDISSFWKKLSLRPPILGFRFCAQTMSGVEADWCQPRINEPLGSFRLFSCGGVRFE